MHRLRRDYNRNDLKTDMLLFLFYHVHGAQCLKQILTSRFAAGRRLQLSSGKHSLRQNVINAPFNFYLSVILTIFNYKKRKKACSYRYVCKRFLPSMGNRGHICINRSIYCCRAAIRNGRSDGPGYRWFERWKSRLGQTLTDRKTL